MIAVISCAARKRALAGRLETPTGQPVTFVAHPREAPAAQDVLFAHPDEVSPDGWPWRETLLKYNINQSDNPLRLLPAWQLYKNPTYERLVRRFGVQSVYILSAGWGMIRSDFLTPYYDITFSATADSYKRRRPKDRYCDFRMLAGTAEDIVFFGSPEYVPLFCELTADVRGKRIVFYRARRPPDAPGCSLRRFETRTRTNWRYECANAFLAGELAST